MQMKTQKTMTKTLLDASRNGCRLHGDPRAQRAGAGAHALRAAIMGPLFISSMIPSIVASASLATGAAADVVRVDEFRPTYARSVGLVEFENPRASLDALDKALRAYSKALSAANATDEAGLLAPMPVSRLGAHAAFVADDPSAREMSGLDLGKSFDGVYRSAVDVIVRRAQDYLASNPSSSSRDAVAAFDALMSPVNAVLLEQDALMVRFNVENGVAVFDPNGALQQPLPRLATLRGIDDSSLPALASQIESKLENLISINDGETRLDFRVGADVVRDRTTGDSILELKVAYVGPAGSPGVAVSSFALGFVGGDGREIKGIADGGEYDLPSAQVVLASTVVRLYRVTEGDRTFLTDFAPGASEADTIEFSLDQPIEQVLGGEQRLSVGALQAVMGAVLNTLKNDPSLGDGGLIGVYVDAAAGQVDMARGGAESPNRTSKAFSIKVVPGIVGSLRVVAAGERVEAEERVDPDGARYSRIKARSPFQPGTPTKQVLRAKTLTDFLDRSSRHPGRRVDAAITTLPPVAAGAEGASNTVGLDYLVTESKPWSVYAQESNTGTEATGEWMTRVGYFNSDLLGNDELFSLEFVTTNLEDSNAVNTYFDAPLGESDDTRWKLLAGWNEYTASDVGFALADFEGSSPFAGAEISHTMYQSGKLFLDAVAGVTWTHAEVTNGLTGRTGEEDFYVPHVGLRLQRNARDAITDCSVMFDYGLGASTTQANLNALGRLNADKDFQILRWDLSQSFYLDTLARAEGDTSPGTLANELYFRAKGQFAFGNRLVPQFMAVGGGFYTVRGYPQSVVAGDNAYMFTGEYRLHLPQIFGVDPDPQPLFGVGDPFRLRPQYGYGPTDWDLILRGFVDVAQISNSDPLSFEFDSTLLGVGGGVEVKFLRNFNIRVDIGFPLEDVQGTTIDDYQVNFVGTLTF